MQPTRLLSLLVILVLAACAMDAPPARSSVEMPQSWRVLVIAGETSEPVFDNARRILEPMFSQDLQAAVQGFSAAASEGDAARPARFASLRAALIDAPPAAGEGCLFYFTTHGSREGLAMRADRRLLTPANLSALLEAGCKDRPTVVVISACYSGIFLNAGLERPNRIILTAARADRSSFGCSATEELNVYDRCFIENWPNAQTWVGLHQHIRGCVEAKERSSGYKPPSQPQAYFGRDLRRLKLHS